MNNNITKSLCAVLTASFFLLACNPLGGGEGGKSDSLRIKVPDVCTNPQEKFALHTSQITPKHGEESVEENGQISLRFSHEPARSGLERALSIAVWSTLDEKFETIDFSLKVEQELVVIQPKEPHLEKSKVYRLRVSNGGSIIQMAACETGQKTLHLYDLGGDLVSQLDVVFATGISTDPSTINFPRSLDDLSLKGDDNGDGIINIEEEGAAYIRVNLSSDAKEGAALSIDGKEYVLSSVDVDNGYVNYDAAQGLAIHEGKNRVVFVDANGEVKEVEFVADLTPPAKPIITHATGKVGVIQNARLSHEDETDGEEPTLRGEAEAGGMVSIHDDDDSLLAEGIVVDENGQWKWQASGLAVGKHTWQVYAYDKAGNKSEEASEPFSLSVVAAIVVNSAIEGVELLGDANNDGVINFSESNNLAVEISLNCAVLSAGNAIHIRFNGEIYDHVLTQEELDACESIKVDLDLGDLDDDNGNVITLQDHDPNSDKITIEFESDLLAPDKPKILGADDRSGGVTGNLYNGSKTDELQPVLRGTAEPRSVVWVFQEGSNVTESAAIPVDADGKWSYAIEEGLLADAEYAWQATATDRALNTSEKSDEFKLRMFDPKLKPEVANTNNALLGIVGADVAGLIQLEQQPFAAVDKNDDVKELSITYQSGVLSLEVFGLLKKLLGFNGTSFTYNSDLADKFGFDIERKDLLGLGVLSSDYMRIKITSKNGGVLNNLLLNEFLATVYSSKDLTQLNLLDSLNLKAKDAGGREHTEDLAQLLGLGLLSNLLGSSQVPDYVHFVPANGSLDLSSSVDAQRVYLFTGNNTVTLGEGNNIVRGGAGADTINVGNGNNLMEGGAGSTALNTGSGVNTLEFRLLDKDHAAGGNGLVTWQNFDNDIIDVSDLLPDAAHRNNIEQYLTIDGSTLKIDRQGQGNHSGELVKFDGSAPASLDNLIINKQLRF